MTERELEQAITEHLRRAGWSVKGGTAERWHFQTVSIDVGALARDLADEMNRAEQQVAA